MGGAEYWKARNELVSSGSYAGNIKIGGVSGTIADFQAASARTGNIYRYGSSQITPTGIKPKHPLVTAKKPRGWAVTYYDQLTPGVQMIEVGIDEGARVVTEQADELIADEIAAIYDAGGEPTWEEVGRSWYDFKAGNAYDLRTMHMTGALEMNVHNLRASLHTFYDTKTGMFTLGGFDTAFAGTEYVWWHELVGAPMSGIRRPFIYQGIERALRATAMANKMVNKVVENLATKVSPVVVYIAPPEPLPMAYAKHRSRLHIGLLAMLMWVMPPSKVWMIMGVASDLVGAGTGQLMESRFLGMWIMAYLRGMMAAKAGGVATKKQARRKFRHAAWDR